MKKPNLKNEIINNLHITFEHPYFLKPFGEHEVDYLAFEDAIFYNGESKSEPPILEQIVRKVAISSILKWYEHPSYSEKFIEQEKNDFKYDDGFTFLFDSTCNWVIINEACNDIMLLIGKNLIETTKELMPNWHSYTTDYFWFKK